MDGFATDKDALIHGLVRAYPRFTSEAYHFVFEALDHTLEMRGGTRRHVSGPEIMEGVRRLALERFGYLARAVLEEWGVQTTDDFGEIVFQLISVDLLQRTADDRREDFVGLFDFATAFDHAFDDHLSHVEI
jgi:uncharacterized repeat protein (TIGR04138 family)